MEGLLRGLSSMQRWTADLRTALAFLTRLPLAEDPDNWEEGQLGAAAWAFPIAGVMVGVAGGVVYVLALAAGLPELAGAVLALAVQILLTGALHEDALADVADGFGGGDSQEAKLEIMRDSRVGAYGVIAIVLSIALRAVAVAAMVKLGDAFAALIACAVLSRAAMGVVMMVLPPAREDGLAAWSGSPSPGVALAGVAIAVLVALGSLGPVGGVVAVLAAGAAAALMGLLALRQIGGKTGDVLGAAQQVSEIAALLALAALLA